jgi:hypothetical protein
LLGMSRSYESSLNFASLTAPRWPSGSPEAWRQQAPSRPASPFGTHRRNPELAILMGKCSGAYVWTQSKNFTDMPMSAGEWHVWLKIAIVGTPGAVWPKGGCAALLNLKRQKVRQRSLRLKYEQLARPTKGSEGTTKGSGCRPYARDQTRAKSCPNSTNARNLTEGSSIGHMRGTEVVSNAPHSGQS